MKFEWDDQKAAHNFAKHGVSFEEASSVFNDPFYIDFYDPEHSEEENRFLITGEADEERHLIVAYTERKNSIRIISARRMTRKERREYEKG